MAKGFDTRANCAAKAAAIKAAGYDFVARYLGRNPEKVIVASEAAALHTAGLGIVLVYEDAPTSIEYFSLERGFSDATRAMQQARLIGAAPGTALYFTVDYDALTSSWLPISAYFAGAAQALDKSGYRVGVYGSGAVCRGMLQRGVAALGWRSQSRGWQGYDAFTDWAISQGPPTLVEGLSVDEDEAVGDYGAFMPEADAA